MTQAQRLDWIKERLTQGLQPSALVIHDDSHKHVGHLGAESGAGHFSIEIQSAHFINLPLLACHRMIYTLLSAAIPSEIHALKIKIIRGC
jgi:BolA protein